MGVLCRLFMCEFYTGMMRRILCGSFTPALCVGFYAWVNGDIMCRLSVQEFMQAFYARFAAV